MAARKMTVHARPKRSGPLPHLDLGPRDRKWIAKYGGTPEALEWAESMQPLVRELEAEVVAAEAHVSHLAQNKMDLSFFPMAEARVESATQHLRELQEYVKALRTKGTEYTEPLMHDAYEAYRKRIQDQWKGV